MAVRPAQLSDVMRLVKIAKEGHAASIYRDKGNIDEAYARVAFARAIQRNGDSHHGGCLLLVSHDGDDIQGYFWGFLDRVYQIGDRLSATEVHFFLSPRASRKDGALMLRAFLDWAHNNDDVIEVLVGKTAIIEADSDGSYEEFLKRKGFEVFGKVYRMDIPRTAEAA